MILFSNFLSKFFNWKQNLFWVFCGQTLFQALYLLLWLHKEKTLKLHLLKKLSIKFHETQDLSSANGKPKLLFYDYNWLIFFSPANHRGERYVFEVTYLPTTVEGKDLLSDANKSGTSKLDWRCFENCQIDGHENLICENLRKLSENFKQVPCYFGYLASTFW